MSTITSINVQAGTTPITPSGGAITINGGTVAASIFPVRTYGTGPSTFETQVQFTQAVASTDSSRVGLAAFNTGQFSVDSNGFVSAIGAALAWHDVTGVTQTIAAGNGYISDNAGTITFTLPASSTFGDVFRIVGLIGGWTIAQNANQQIKFGSTATTVGAGGSLSSTNAGNCVELVATNTGVASIYRVISVQGNLTVV